MMISLDSGEVMRVAGIQARVQRLNPGSGSIERGVTIATRRPSVYWPAIGVATKATISPVALSSTLPVI
jgi:hypothetical protein